MEANRSPRWPEGFVGSITHCDGLVAAVVAQADRIEGIGLDIEPAIPLPGDLIPLICLPEELTSIASISAPSSANWPKVLFSAKESIHKCVAPRSGIMLDFRDVSVVVDPLAGTFHARLVKGEAEILPEFTRIEGRFLTTPEYVWTSASIPNPGVAP
jgi:4'-phosphopantetheinyl transferase EntD